MRISSVNSIAKFGESHLQQAKKELLLHPKEKRSYHFSSFLDLGVDLRLDFNYKILVEVTEQQRSPTHFNIEEKEAAYSTGKAS